MIDAIHKDIQLVAQAEQSQNLSMLIHQMEEDTNANNEDDDVKLKF